LLEIITAAISINFFMTLFWGKFTFYNNYTFNLVQLWHSLILLFQLVLALAIVNEKVAKKS
jgi:hypothetical protein